MAEGSLATIYERGRPEVDEAWVARFLSDRFGLTGEVSELGSQQDRNFRIDTPQARYVLKIFHTATPVAVVEDQLAAMRLLAAAGIPAPQEVAGADGEVRQSARAEDGSLHCAVLLTYLDGVQLVGLTRISRRLACALADLAGRTCAALAAAPAHPRTSQWDLRVPLEVVRELAGVVPPPHRGELLAVSEAAWQEVERYADQLPLQVIHGDITDDNVVARTGAEGALEPVGVIDFGDLMCSWRVGELVVLLASMLHHELDDRSVLVDMVAAFDAVVGLSEAEKRVIWPLVQLRCAVLVVSGWQQLRVDPGNGYAAERMAHEAACFEQASALPTSVMTNLLLFGSLQAPRPATPLVRARVESAPVVVSLAPESELMADGRWLAPDAEDAVLSAAVGSHGLIAVPQGEYRLSRSTASLDSVGPSHYSLIAELVAARSFAVEACAPLQVDSVASDRLVASTSDGRRLRLTGLAPAVAVGDQVAAGALLGEVVSSGAVGLHRLGVQLGDGESVPSFCTADVALGYAPLVAGTNSAIGLPEPELLDPLAQSAAEQERRNRFLPPNTERYYAEPPTIVRGWGAYLIDSRARVYLDLVNNVAAIGHSHPALRRAVSAELDLLNTNSRFLYRRLADYSERLLATTGAAGYDSVLLVNSGTEAVDLALRIAKLATGREQVITHAEGYHGWSMASDAITTSGFDNPTALLNRPSWVSVANSPNPYRGLHRGPDAAGGYLADFSALLDGLDAAGTPAGAVVMESILGNSGGVVPPRGYFAGIIAQLRARGGVSIADEVQVGFGRTGTSFWAAQAEGARPDIIVSAKAMGNGFPLGAVITTKELSSVLGKEGPFFSTTGGSPAACAAGLAVLNVIEAEGLRERAESVGGYLSEQLAALAGRHPLIGAIHGRGFYQGVELVTDRELLTPAAAEAAGLCEALLRRGIVDQATSERQNVLKVKPPMTFSRSDVDHFSEALDDLLTKGWK